MPDDEDEDSPPDISRFSDEDRAEFEEAFKLFDKDDDGQLLLNEFEKALRAVGLITSEGQVKEMFVQEDTGHSGIIDFDAFLRILARNLPPPNIYEDLIKSFRVFDRKDNNYLTVKECKEIFTTYGDPFTEEELELFIKDGDPEKSGMILYTDLCGKIARKLMVRPKKKKKKEAVKEEEAPLVLGDDELGDLGLRSDSYD